MNGGTEGAPHSPGGVANGAAASTASATGEVAASVVDDSKGAEAAGTSVEDGDEEDEDEESDDAGTTEDEAEDDEDDEEGEEESDGEDEDEGDDEEPTLKYSRLFPAVISGLLAPPAASGSTAAPPKRARPSDNLSAIAVSQSYVALGTDAGLVHVLSLATGEVLKKVRLNTARVNTLVLLEREGSTGGEWIVTAGMDGQLGLQPLCLSQPGSVSSLPSTEVLDLRRPLLTLALDPAFPAPLSRSSSTRRFLSGGMAGVLLLHERGGWLGGKETRLQEEGEGPIWAAEWSLCGKKIAWGNDWGVKVYEMSSASIVFSLPRSANSPRADLYPLNLHFVSAEKLVVAWADFIRILSLPATDTSSANPEKPKVRSVLQVDGMVTGLVPYTVKPQEAPVQAPADEEVANGNVASSSTPELDTYLVLAYPVPAPGSAEAEGMAFKREKGQLPELRLISEAGEESFTDVIGFEAYETFQARSYRLRIPGPASTRRKKTKAAAEADKRVYLLSPKEVVVASLRSEADHIAYLVEKEQYQSALDALERCRRKGIETPGIEERDVGRKFLEHLVGQGQFSEAASRVSKILDGEKRPWEDWIFFFVDAGHIEDIIPYVPTDAPQLSRMVYEMILAHFLRKDPATLLKTIKTWPGDIYDTSAVILAVKAELEVAGKRDDPVLLESVSELYMLSHQPGKALPYLFKLKRTGVFDLIREHNLFTDVQEQVVHLVEFERDVLSDGQQPLLDKRKHGEAMSLLVDHTDSIPISKVVAQLQGRREYLFKYLDALFDKDPHLGADYSDAQVELYADFKRDKLMEFLWASNYYSLEKALEVCEGRDLVPEMVFLLGRMGNNNRALTLIIERLGDVQRAIDFAKEQNDDDLWEDLLKYSETRPAFIRGLLESVGGEIDPLRLIRRISNGLEIPNLKAALIKTLQEYNLRVSLMEGCKAILYSDARDLAMTLHRGQVHGFLFTGDVTCAKTGQAIFPQLSTGIPSSSDSFGIHFLCGHTYSSQAIGADHLMASSPIQNAVISSLLEEPDQVMSSTTTAKQLGKKTRFAAELAAHRADLASEVLRTRCVACQSSDRRL